MSPHAILQHYGYFGVAIALILEFLFIPFPAETILVFSGVMLHKGLFSTIPLITVATLSSWIGSLIAYYIGSIIGRPVLLRYGKYVKLDEAKLHTAETYLRKYSIAILGIGRFIAGIRVVIAYVAGLNRIGIFLYAIITLFSAALWSTFFILIGGTIGARWNEIVHFVKMHPVLSVLLAVIIVGAMTYLWVRRRRKERAAKIETPRPDRVT